MVGEGSIAARVHEVIALDHSAGEILVGGAHTGVDDGDDHARTIGRRPGSLEVEAVERPLAASVGVVDERLDGGVRLHHEHVGIGGGTRAEAPGARGVDRVGANLESAVFGAFDDHHLGLAGR